MKSLTVWMMVFHSFTSESLHTFSKVAVTAIFAERFSATPKDHSQPLVRRNGSLALSSVWCAKMICASLNAGAVASVSSSSEVPSAGFFLPQWSISLDLYALRQRKSVNVGWLVKEGCNWTVTSSPSLHKERLRQHAGLLPSLKLRVNTPFNTSTKVSTTAQSRVSAFRVHAFGISPSSILFHVTGGREWFPL